MAWEFFIGLLIINWLLFYFKYLKLFQAIAFSFLIIISWLVFIYRAKEELTPKEDEPKDKS